MYKRQDNNYITKSDDNELFIVKDDGYLYHYQREKQAFRKLEVPPVAFEHVLSTIVDENNILWIFTSDHEDVYKRQIIYSVTHGRYHSIDQQICFSILIGK